MLPACDLPAEDLIAYAEGAFRAARKELVEAHLQVCPACRRRLAAFREVDRLLRESRPPIDDLAGRAALRARLEVEAGRRAQRQPSRTLLAVAALLVAVLTAIAWPALSGTQAGWSQFYPLRDGGPRTLPAGQEPPGTRITGVQPPQPGLTGVRFRAVEPADLPLGLALVERSAVSAERLELLYRNQQGLTILIVQVPARGSVDVPPDAAAMQLVTVGDTAVVRRNDPRPGAVVGLTWQRQGVSFDLVALGTPAQGLPFEDARAIAEALMIAQEVTR